MILLDAVLRDDLGKAHPETLSGTKEDFMNMSVIVWLYQTLETIEKYRKLREEHKLGSWKILEEPKSKQTILKLEEDLFDPLLDTRLNFDPVDYFKVTVVAIYDDVYGYDEPNGLPDGTYTYNREAAQLYCRSNFNYGEDRTTIQRKVTIKAETLEMAKGALEAFFTAQLSENGLVQTRDFSAKPPLPKVTA